MKAQEISCSGLTQVYSVINNNKKNIYKRQITFKILLIKLGLLTSLTFNITNQIKFYYFDLGICSISFLNKLYRDKQK